MNGKYQLSLVLALVMLMLAAAVLGASAAGDAVQDIPFPDQRDAAAAAVDWLFQENQNPDGGFGSFAPESSFVGTLDAVMALSAAGYDVNKPYPGTQKTTIDYLKENADELVNYAANSGGENGKVILAMAAANQDARDFEGHDYVAQLQAQYDPVTGSFNNSTAFLQALSIMALRAVNEPVPEDALEWLEELQAGDGSWDDGFGGLRNADATGMAVMALLVGGRELSDSSLEAALEFLADSQLESAGWGYSSDFPDENANSTALVVQALAATGQDFYSSGGEWSRNGISPLGALLSWQSPTGAFQADFGGIADNLFATQQSVAGAVGKAYPLPSRYEAASVGLACLAQLQDVATGGWEQVAGGGISAAGTSRAIQAIAAAGGNPQAAVWTPGDTNAVEALENETPTYLVGRKGAAPSIVAQGVVAAGEPYDVTDFAERDLLALISSFLAPDGSYDDTTMAHAQAMLGLLATGEEVDDSAVAFLLSKQTDGDWGTPEQTGLALNVLGRQDIFLGTAVEQLAAAQKPDGGWGQEDHSSDPSTTAEVVQGLVQQGELPFSPEWSIVSAGTVRNAADLIISQQQEDGCWLTRDGLANDPSGTMDAILLLTARERILGTYTQLMPIILVK